MSKLKAFAHNNFNVATEILQNFADDNFEFDKKGGTFSERVENAVGKGEIARYEQVLLFPQCFQKTSVDLLQTSKNQDLFGKGLKVN